MLPDLYTALNLPPAKAMEYFTAKGYTLSWDWHDVWQDAHAHAFTVAKVARMDILQDIRDSVNKAIEDGITFTEFRKQLEPTLRAKGWWGKQMLMDENGQGTQVQLGSPWRLRTIYDTNVQTAYMAGRYKSQIDNADDRPFWQFVVVLDSRTSRICTPLAGLVFRYDDPIWDSLYPPNHWRCRTRVRALSADDLDDAGISTESSEGKLYVAQRQVSKSSDKVVDVTGYRAASGKTIEPDPGWSYNPGKAKWAPDLDKYDADIRALFDKENQ
jgi:SPP1 gp7 family putative phage head morphogenesis protein